MYSIILILHNLLRWLVLVYLGLALFKTLGGLFKRSSWTDQHLKAVRRFGLILSVQFVLGVILYFLPNGLVQLSIKHQGISEVMKSVTLRFFVVEHFSMMLIALCLAHVNTVLMKKLKADRKKFIIGSVMLVTITGIIFMAIPWPFFEYSRPLIPDFKLLIEQF